MDSVIELLVQEALELAQAGELDNANITLRSAFLYMSEEEVKESKELIGLAYLKACGEPIHFGVVPHGAYHIGRISWDSYTGLSPYAKPKLFVTRPTYNVDDFKLEVLVQFAKREWVYGMFTRFDPDAFYGGRVVGFNKGVAEVIPFFSTDGIKSIASRAINKLGGADYHEWDVPEDFSLDNAEYVLLQEQQTNLALKSVGLPTKY